MAPPPELTNDLMMEILLRIAPDDHRHLYRASLVCKLWHHILSDHCFLRRYSTFHQCPNLLGFFYNLDFPGPFSGFVATTGAGSPLPTTVDPASASSPLPEFDDLRVSWTLDCRHGRVLFRKKKASMGLVVWDPVTDVWTELPPPDVRYESYSAVVLCDVADCDHRNCHGGQFIVVCVGIDDWYHTVYACVYSSEDQAWHVPVAEGRGCRSFDVKRPAVIGDGIYYMSDGGRWIHRYDLVEHEFSSKRIRSPYLYRRDPVLMQNEDGSLGFAGIKGSTLYLWSMRCNDPEEGGGLLGWEQWRVIKLRNLLPVGDMPCIKANVIGFAEGVGVFFISTNVGVFTVELRNSERVMKVSEASNNFRTAYPFISLFTPGRASPRVANSEIHQV